MDSVTFAYIQVFKPRPDRTWYFVRKMGTSLDIIFKYDAVRPISLTRMLVRAKDDIIDNLDLLFGAEGGADTLRHDILSESDAEYAHQLLSTLCPVDESKRISHEEFLDRLDLFVHECFGAFSFVPGCRWNRFIATSFPRIPRATFDTILFDYNCKQREL